jgi:hypothetical protein
MHSSLSLHYKLFYLLLIIWSLSSWNEAVAANIS